MAWTLDVFTNIQSPILEHNLQSPTEFARVENCETLIHGPSFNPFLFILISTFGELYPVSLNPEFEDNHFEQ